MNKFARCAWYPGPDNVPILRECDNWFVGRILERLDLGDHVGFRPDPVEAHREPGKSHGEFQRAKCITPGLPV